MVIIIRQVVLVVCRHQLNDTTSRLRLFTGYMPRLDPPSHSITNNRNVASQYSYLECETF